MTATPKGNEPDGAVGSVTSDLTLDRLSPVPLYFQVAQHIEKAIQSGAVGPGTHIDNEIQLAGELGLSRPTMRQALQYLVDKGLLVRRRGVGTRVVQSKVRRPLELTSLYDDLLRADQRPTTAVLALAQEPANATVARALDLNPGDTVTRLVRLRSARDVPIARLTNWIPGELVEFTTEQLEAGGLYRLMRAAGVQLHAATQSIGAKSATAAEAKVLAEAKGAALLTMQRTAYDDHGRAVEYGDHLYAASRYSFEMSLLAG